MTMSDRLIGLLYGAAIGAATVQFSGTSVTNVAIFMIAALVVEFGRGFTQDNESDNE